MESVAVLPPFTWIVLDGLRRLGIKVSEGEADAYLQCWNAIGHTLGIHP